MYISNLIGVENIELKSLEDYLESLEMSKKVKNPCEKSIEDINQRLELLESLNLEEEYIEAVKGIKQPEKSLKELNEALEIKKQKLAKMENYLKSLLIAKECIEETSNDIRKNFIPLLNKEASEILKKLTGEKYYKAYIQKDYNMMLEYEKINRSCDSLSSGTIDQAYLSLRIALSKLLSRETNLPLILDDVLVRYDEERLKYTLKFLKEYSKNHQVILFTCHNYYSKMLY